MQLQFIVALLVVLAFCEGCTGMNSWFDNDKRKSTNFTSSSNQPKSKGKEKMSKQYSSGSDDGRQSMHQYPFYNSGFTAPTNSGTRGGSRTTHQNVSNFGGFTAPTNSGTRGGSQTKKKKASNFFTTIDAGYGGSVVWGETKFKSQTVQQLPQNPFPPNYFYTTGDADDKKPMTVDMTLYEQNDDKPNPELIDSVYKMTGNGH